ncbi:hypothetical protein VNO77_34389 [Canavalia gladiata]|uniref:Uncharacterized protein n=1 Tax=Canavalia gladiata TaxID=3824 RepID=A0AAN9KFH0_CANGL
MKRFEKTPCDRGSLKKALSSFSDSSKEETQGSANFPEVLELLVILIITVAISVVSAVIKENIEEILEELQACQAAMGNCVELCSICLINPVTERIPENIREVLVGKIPTSIGMF